MPTTARAAGASWRAAVATSAALPYASSGPSGAVQQDQFRVAVLPHQRAQPPAGGHLGEGPPHDRRTAEAQPELRGVLTEQPELVVVD
jgi:hypothetical protein